MLAQIRRVLEGLAGRKSLREGVSARLRALLGGTRPSPSPKQMRERIRQLEAKLTVLERLDAEERKAIGQEAANHEAKAELAKLGRRLAESASAPATPAADIPKIATDVLEGLRTLDGFDRLPIETRKAFFRRFVDRIDLEFSKRPYGRRETWSFTRGGSCR